MALEKQRAGSPRARMFVALDRRPLGDVEAVAAALAESAGPAPLVELGERLPRRPMRVESPPEKLPTGLAEPFYGVRLTLYRSELQPRGARCAPLAQVELPGGGRQ